MMPALLKVVDIGGSQKPVGKRLRNRGEGTEYKILDLPTPHESSQAPDIIADIQEELPFTLIGSFDVAFCLEVMEYVIKPLEVLKNCAFLLKRGGVLYISFNFIYPHHKPEGEDCLRYTKWGAEKLLAAAGFKIEEFVERSSESGVLETFYQTERMHWDRVGIDPEFIGCLIKATKI